MQLLDITSIVYIDIAIALLGLLLSVFPSKYIYKKIKSLTENRRSRIAKDRRVVAQITDIHHHVISNSERLDKVIASQESDFRLDETPTIITSPDGQVTDVNDALLKLYGATREGMSGTGYLQYLHPEDRDQVYEVWTNAINSGATDISYDYRIIHGITGEVVNCKYHAVIIRHGKTNAPVYIKIIAQENKNI